MFIGATSNEENTKALNCLQNSKLQLTFLGVGAILITLGIVLLSIFQSNTGLSNLGSILCTIGTPLILYGIIGLIYSRVNPKPIKKKEEVSTSNIHTLQDADCANKKDNQKKTEQTDNSKLSESDKKKIRKKRLQIFSK